MKVKEKKPMSRITNLLGIADFRNMLQMHDSLLAPKGHSQRTPMGLPHVLTFIAMRHGQAKADMFNRTLELAKKQAIPAVNIIKIAFWSDNTIELTFRIANEIGFKTVRA